MKNKREPDKITIELPAVGVQIWGSLGFKTCVPATIKLTHPKKRLRGVTVAIIGPGESYVKKAKTINRQLIIKNETLQVRITCMPKKSNEFSVGDEFEILPKFLKAAW